MSAVELDEGPVAVQQWISRGANPNTGNSDWCRQPIFIAVQSRSPETVRVLLNAGASVRPVSPARVGPIFAITWQVNSGRRVHTESESRAIIQELTAKGESIEDRDALGYTPLLRAVWGGNVLETKTLLDLNANTDVVNYQNQTIWTWADMLPGKAPQLRELIRESHSKHH